MHRSTLILTIISIAAATGPALAGARDDMLAGISRCGVLADDRAFLDCVYGAAQPLRAQLGLPPAPAAQQHLVPSPGYARPFAPVVQGAVAQVPAPPPPRRQGFLGGLFGGQHPVLHIVSYTFDKDDMFTVTLSDGEVWRQADNDVHYAHWRGPAPRAAVTLSTSTFGGATMSMESENDPYLVVRVR